MAGCGPNTTTYEEVMNARKHDIGVLQPLLNQTQAETIERLEFFRNNVELVNDEYYLFGRKLKVKKRVSELAKYIMKLSKDSLSTDNDIKRNMGTRIHEVARLLMDNYIKHDGDLPRDIKFKLTDESKEHEYKLTETQFEQIRILVKKTYDKIQEQQKKINSKGTVKIFTEQFVMDFKKDVGGTIDVLAVFSDNTASVYDYKTTSRDYVINKGSKGEDIVSENMFPYYESQAYDIAMTEYKRILLQRVGVKNVRHNRLLPIALRYEPIPYVDQTEGHRIKPKLLTLLANEDLTEFLKPIPTGGESTRWAGINKLIEKQYRLLGTLSKSYRDRGLTIDQKESIKQRIQKIEKSIRKTLIDEDVYGIIEAMHSIASEVKIRLEEPMMNDNNESNPAYPSIDELQDMMHEMETYSDVIAESHVYFKELRESDEAKYITLKQELNKIEPHYENILVALKLEIENRVSDVIGKEHLDEEGHIKPFEELGFFDLNTSRMSQIDNPLFQAGWKLIREAQYDIKEEFKNMDKEVWDKTDKLWAWAKEHGLERQEAYDMMINQKSGNLYSKLNPNFYNKIESALAMKDDAGLKIIQDSYEIRDKKKFKEEYKIRLEAEKARLKARYNNFENIVRTVKDESGNLVDEIIETSEKLKAKYEKELQSFDDRNNLLDSDKAWTVATNLRRYCKIKDSVFEANYSDEYKKIKLHKPLLDYYEMWHKYMKDFSEMLGITEYKKLPENFIPNIRKELAEFAFGDKDRIKASFTEFLDSFSTREEDIYVANVDENGQVNQIPVLFMNKFRDKNNKIDNTKKSYELSSSLMIFGKMALNYKYMNSIEPKINALKIVMGDPTPEQGGIEATDTFSRRIKGKVQNYMTKEGRMTETYQLFNDITDYYLYGIKFKTKNPKGTNMVHLLSKAKNFNSGLKLGFAVIPAAGAMTAGHVGVYLIGKKGISYTSDQLNDAVKDMVKDGKKATAIGAFFDPYNDDYADREYQKYKTSWKLKSLDRALFAFLRRADISITKKVVNAMVRNYGIDKNGNIVRLNRPGLKGEYKSIHDSIKFNKDGSMTVEGMGKEGMIQFIAAVRSTMGGIIGNMNPEDIGKLDVSLLHNQMAAFRSWMPEVVAERLGKLKYDDAVQALKWGRYRAALSEYSYKVTEQEFADGQKIQMYIENVLVPNITNLILDISTFGLVPSLVKARVNEARAHRMYQKFIEENPHLANKINYEMFLEVKQGQIKAMLVEIRIILGFLGLILFLGGEADDGEKRYTHLWGLRTLYKSVNKAGSELTFMWNPAEFERLMKNPFPVTGLLTQVRNTLKNTFDESRDVIFGENSKRDITPPMYYTLQWMKGAPQVMRFIEVYENMKRNPYTIFQ